MQASVILSFLGFTVITCFANPNAPLACNLQAISPTERPRYHHLAERLRKAVSQRVELQEGYTYTLNPEVIALIEIAEWISMERVCCPFFTFQIDVEGEAETRLTIRGPRGAKAILKEVFA